MHAAGLLDGYKPDPLAAVGGIKAERDLDIAPLCRAHSANPTSFRTTTMPRKAAQNRVKEPSFALWVKMPLLPDAVLKTDSDGKELKLRPGDVACVIHEGFKADNLYWKMRVDELRQDGRHVWVIGRWFNSSADIAATFENTADLVGFLGKTELMISEHQESTLLGSVEDVCHVVKFRDTAFITDKPLGYNTWCYRFKLMDNGRIAKLTSHCICGEVYNPDKSVQRFCITCGKWFDIYCILLSAANQSAFTLETSSKTATSILGMPIVRGALTGPLASSWRVSGSGAMIVKVLGWYRAGAFPEDWKRQLPKGFAEYASNNTALPRYECPGCSAVI
ncbi:hypothetical protein M413DRAFT_32639 [Hebeloma cylindrosporum]|uniref:BAH domain-containing protein n=1 Tax=Hebeloma cylindrosporum TaxID=76867 RepID=A0A0C3BV20_HEBCY|nr:hypothetical protein M413DRAFT_32639 [Hebeloma cylindrosporum h7]